MKKVELLNDTMIPGYGKISAGTQFDVIRHNSRWVYVKLGKFELKLSVKEVKKIR